MPDQTQRSSIRITARDETTWVGLKQAMEIAGITSKASLYYYVDQADGVRSQKGENSRANKYNLADLKRLHSRRFARKRTEEPAKEPEVIFDWLEPKDLGAVLDLDMRVFNKSIVGDYNLYKSWIEKNTHVAMCAFENKVGSEDRRKCLAYISALPLEERNIISILKGEKDELDITSNEIETYEREGAYTLLVNSVVASEEKYLGRVLDEVLKYWIESYPKRYITRIYAQAASQTGDVMIQKMRLGPVFTLDGDTVQPLDDAYTLDLTRPAGSPIIRRFQQALAEKR